ncbi:tRNA (adenosine(37)-N6)-threonylcarbamoyltransferase complex dimerization subunit type 1 TsaB [Nesterenkonia halophila]|uniref:tRNA (adenosine(37)-N6)-threonylcarbamoyltransferase complex dimerization subunit type 1 TsaB n=1 Tax=Nesterenkonia halophila TaxID=302044 RepID=UPI001291069D|nr:tRNA (adenosine(37)-N6)-threonylcarbamoyltransferase complex dimerization subunit type 1 TsaB [Nesterenkonia halophila]
MLLAIDSSAGASAAVTDGETVLAHRRTDATTTHAEVLAPAVREVLIEAGIRGAELDGVVVGVGPGPFTGLRVGLVLAHSLAEAWDLPLHGIGSLESLARRAARHGLTGEFLVTADARRREVHWARCRAAAGAAELLDGPHVGPAPDPAARGLGDLPAVGRGVSLYPEDLAPAPGLPEDAARWTADAAELGQLAAAGAVLRDPLPLYLRESDAVAPTARKAVS